MSSALDNLITEFTFASTLDAQIDTVMFRLNALKSGKKLYFKFKDADSWSIWEPSFTNTNALLEGTDTCPSIIEMDVEWQIEG